MRMACNGIVATTACWRGRATEARLRAHLVAYNESLKPGGCNARVAAVFGLASATAYRASIHLNTPLQPVVCAVTL